MVALSTSMLVPWLLSHIVELPGDKQIGRRSSTIGDGDIPAIVSLYAGQLWWLRGEGWLSDCPMDDLVVVHDV